MLGAWLVKEIRQNLVFSAGPTFGNFVFGDDIKALEEAVAELKAMAEALRSGSLGVLDYYNMKNVQADTKMKTDIGNGVKEYVEKKQGWTD